MVMTQRTVRRFLQLFTFQEFNAPHTRRRTQMIHDGIGLVESLRRNDVFVSDTFVLVSRSSAVAMKPDVMLPRNFAELLIEWHKFGYGLFVERSKLEFPSSRSRAPAPFPSLT